LAPALRRAKCITQIGITHNPPEQEEFDEEELYWAELKADQKREAQDD